MDDGNQLGDDESLTDLLGGISSLVGTQDQNRPWESGTGQPSDVLRNDPFLGIGGNLFDMPEGFDHDLFSGNGDDRQPGNDLSSIGDISNMPGETQIGNPEENTADHQLHDASGSVTAPNLNGLFNMNGHPPVVPVENSTVSPAQLQPAENDTAFPAQLQPAENNTAFPAQLQLVQNNTASPAQHLLSEQQQQLPIFQQQQQQQLGLIGLQQVQPLVQEAQQQQVQPPAQLNRQQRHLIQRHLIQRRRAPQPIMQQRNMQQLNMQQLNMQQLNMQQHQIQQFQMHQSLDAADQILLKIRGRVYPIFDSCNNLVFIINKLSNARVHNQGEILALCQITDQTYSAVSHWKTLLPTPLTAEALQSDPPMFGKVADSCFDIALFKALSISRDLTRILERVQSDGSLWGYNTHQRTVNIRRAIVECHMVTLHIFYNLLCLLLLDRNPTGMGLAGLGQGQRDSNGATRFNFKHFVLQTVYSVVADQLIHARSVLPTLPQPPPPQQQQEQQVPITAAQPQLIVFQRNGGQVRVPSPQEILRGFLAQQQALQSQNQQQLPQQQLPIAFQSGTGQQFLPRPITFTHATDTEITALENHIQGFLNQIQQRLSGQYA
ncbi:hypothetical protein V8C42DRAFT_342756 [Trichoderma barbatum]